VVSSYTDPSDNGDARVPGHAIMPTGGSPVFDLPQHWGFCSGSHRTNATWSPAGLESLISVCYIPLGLAGLLFEAKMQRGMYDSGAFPLQTGTNTCNRAVQQICDNEVLSVPLRSRQDSQRSYSNREDITSLRPTFLCNSYNFGARRCVCIVTANI